MQKRIAFWGRWILGMVLIAGAVVAVTYKDQQARVKYQRECQEHMASIAVPVGKYTSGGDECKDPKDYMPWWDILVAWPEGITTWAIILTLGAISWQAFEARKSTDVARDAVNAAYGSVTFAEAQWKLMIEEKRARLEVDVDRRTLTVESESGVYLRHLIATLKIRNIGESKAYIRRAEGILITKAPDAPLEPDSHLFNSLDIPTPLEPHPDATEIKVYLFLDDTKLETFADCLDESILSLHLSGFIEYQTLGICYRKEFRYRWMTVTNFSTGKMLGLTEPFYPNSPKHASDRIRYGSWWRDEEKPESTDCEQSEKPN